MNETTTRDVVMRWLDALAAGEFDTALACLDENIHWVNSPGKDGTTGGVPGLSAIVPWFGDFRTKAEVMATFGPYAAAQETLEYERLNVMFKDDQALVLVREKARVKATGQIYEIEFVQRYQVANGKIVLLRAYLDTCRMVAAFRGDMASRLLDAAHSGDVAAAAQILPFGADPNQADATTGDTALIIAAGLGHVEVVRRLLAHGAEPNLISRTSGDSALHAAARSGRTATLDALLGAGAMPNIQRPGTGETPLHEALKSGAGDCAARLIAAGANRDVVAFDGTRAGEAAADRDAAGPGQRRA